MSKAEKLKKICKKVWKMIIPIIIISAIIGAILVVPKYYNKGGDAVETGKLAVSPSYNWEVLVASILGGFFLAILILVLILNSRRKNSKLMIEAGRSKMSYGKIWKWIIPIVIISTLIGISLVVAPKYIKKWKEKGDSKLSIPATTIWTKKPHQYGRNPEKRTSGYINAEVTEDSDTKFCFTVFTKRGNSYYNGRKTKGGKIEGSWRNPPEGGKWYLEKDKVNPNLYKGGINDLDLLDWADFELELSN